MLLRIAYLSVFLLMTTACSEEAGETNLSINDDKFLSTYKHAQLIDPEYKIQLDDSLKKRLRLILDPANASKEESKVDYLNGVSVYDGTPYFPYWQSGDQRYRFHAMAYGYFLSKLEPGSADTYLDGLVSSAFQVGTDGLLWFYPDNYPVSRMIDLYLPSAISQGQILGGLLALADKGSSRARHLLKPTFHGLAHPYWQGGINLNDKALIELPLVNAPPEIILNGWLHALLFLGSYAELSEEDEAKNLFASNIRFLSDVLQNFNDPVTGLSLYSDLSPYRVCMTSEHSDLQYEVLYRSNSKSLDDVRTRLTNMTQEGDVSPYTNHISIITSNLKKKYGWVSLSKNYDTYIISEQPFFLEIDTGKYDPLKATPQRTGETKRIQSEPLSEKHVIRLDTLDGVFKGSPTNFAKKGGLNYYHVYHVVALAILLDKYTLPESAEVKMREMMLHWHKTMSSYEPPEGTRFAQLYDVYSNIAKHHKDLSVDEQSWMTIWESAISVSKRGSGKSR